MRKSLNLYLVIMRRIIIISFFIVYGILFESVLIYLFPYSELAGLANYPIALIISLLIGIVFILFNINVKKYAIIGVLIQMYLLIVLLPQSRGGIVKQIGNYVKAYNNYELINYNSFRDYNHEERVAYIYKFEKVLPKEFIVIGLEKDDSPSKEFVLEKLQNVNYKLINGKLCLIIDDSLVIDESKNKKIKIPLKNIENEIIYKHGSVVVFINAIGFDIDEGIESVFYSYLKRKKKRVVELQPKSTR
jgi:hypothetical protein